MNYPEPDDRELDHEELMNELNFYAARAVAAQTELKALRAQLDAQQWQPGSATPPAPNWYFVLDFSEDDVPARRYYGDAGWGVLGDESAPDWYMAIPPLPDAAARATQEVTAA